MSWRYVLCFWIHPFSRLTLPSSGRYNATGHDTMYVAERRAGWLCHLRDENRQGQWGSLRFCSALICVSQSLVKGGYSWWDTFHCWRGSHGGRVSRLQSYQAHSLCWSFPCGNVRVWRPQTGMSALQLLGYQPPSLSSLGSGAAQSQRSFRCDHCWL